MANRLGDISKQYLSQVERNKIKNPGTAVLNKLAYEFGVTVDFLISGIEGNKDNYLASKTTLLNSINLCREKLENSLPGSKKTAFIYKKTGNLLELFDVICHCLQFDVLDNYDLYTCNLDKLSSFIGKITAFLDGETVGPDLERVIDQSFWRLGMTLREFAIQIDRQGRRNFSSKELAGIAGIIEEFMGRYRSGRRVLEKGIEIETIGGRLNLTYSGIVNVPEEYWQDLARRMVFEWEIIMRKIGGGHSETG